MGLSLPSNVSKEGTLNKVQTHQICNPELGRFPSGCPLASLYPGAHSRRALGREKEDPGSTHRRATGSAYTPELSKVWHLLGSVAGGGNDANYETPKPEIK